MSDKCQITPAKVFASCETYNCRKKIAWGIGRPDGPIQLQKFYCDQCMRDILSNIPEELLPTAQINKDAEYIATLYGELFNLATPEEQAIMVGKMLAIIDPEYDEADRRDIEPGQQPEPKKYTCDYCNEPFDTSIQKATHVRNCKAKKEAATNEKQDEPS